MTMLSIRLDPEIEERLEELASSTGRTKSYYVRLLIEEYLDELEDRFIAEHRLEHPQPTLTLEQVRKALELED